MTLAGLIGPGGRCECRFDVDITGGLQILDFSGFNQDSIRSKKELKVKLKEII